MEELLELETEGATKTYCKITGCKKLYISLIYKPDDTFKKIDYIKIYGEARSNDCGCSYLEAIADLCSMLLKRLDPKKRSEMRLLVKALRDHRCNRPCLAPPGERTSSCADAIGQVLQAELGITNEELRGRG